MANVVSPWYESGAAPQQLRVEYPISGWWRTPTTVSYSGRDLPAPGSTGWSAVYGPGRDVSAWRSDVYLLKSTPPNALSVRVRGSNLKDAVEFFACPYLALKTPTKQGQKIVPYFVNGTPLVADLIRSDALIVNALTETGAPLNPYPSRFRKQLRFSFEDVASPINKQEGTLFYVVVVDSNGVGDRYGHHYRIEWSPTPTKVSTP